MKKILSLFVLFLFLGVVNAQTQLPIFGSSDQVYYYGTFNDFLKKKFFVSVPTNSAGDRDGFSLQLNSNFNGMTLTRDWRYNGSSLYYTGGSNPTNVGIGTATPSGTLDIYNSNAILNIKSPSNNAALNITSYNTSNPNNSVGFYGYKGSESTPVSVSSETDLGKISWNGYDGTTMREGGYMKVVVDGAVTSNNVPTRYTFGVRRAGFGAVTDRLEIKNRGHIGINRFNAPPNAWLHVWSEFGTNIPVLKLSPNTGTDTVSIWVQTSTPGLNASIGDLSIIKDGSLWQNRTGAFNGWGKFLNLRDANSATTGQVIKWDGNQWLPSNDNNNVYTTTFFSSTPNSAGLSISVTNQIALHAANKTNPGGVSTTDQEWAGQKMITSDLAGGVTYPLAVKNNLATAAGSGTAMQFLGASNDALTEIVSTKETSGTTMTLFTETGTSMAEQVKLDGVNRINTTYGWSGGDVTTIAANINLNVHLNANLRKKIYYFTGAGSGITLPDPQGIAIGTEFEWHVQFTSGTQVVIDSNNGTYNEFIENNSSAAPATNVTLPLGRSSGKFVTMSEGGVMYWKLITY